MLVDDKLEEAAKKAMGESKYCFFLDYHSVYAFIGQGTAWVSRNSGSLYMTLSEPCKDLMQVCRKHASNLILDGFDLRLSIWLEDSESAHQEAIISGLLDDSVFPPKCLMELGTDNKLHFLENKVVWNVILNTVRELNFYKQLDELDSLSCAAAVAVYGALEKIGSANAPANAPGADAESLSATLKDLYTKLMYYIEVTIKNTPELRVRWERYKQCIKARLAQYQ